MNGLHFTMREIFKPQNVLLQAALCATAIALFVHIGPFGTFYDMTLGPRTLYWGVIMLVNWSISAIAFQAAVMLATANSKRVAPIVIATALAVSIPATLTVYLVNATMRPEIMTFVTIPSLFGSVVMITLIFGCICIAVSQRRISPEATPNIPEATLSGPTLLRRLPPELRGALIRLSMNDHYVEVETTKGATLVLLRFADALEELGDAKGLQVHRSHWVATDAVTSARRDGSRLFLTLSTGQEIPVSRTYRNAARDAGII